VKKGTIIDPAIVTSCGCARNFKGLNVFLETSLDHIATREAFYNRGTISKILKLCIHDLEIFEIVGFLDIS
jgi:hypothetical protein